jgi:hypothetical protein
MDVIIAWSKGMRGRIVSRSSAAFMRSVEGSRTPAPFALPFIGSVWPGTGEPSRLGRGVSAGGGEPAIEERGVNSASSCGRRERRLKGFGF